MADGSEGLAEGERRGCSLDLIPGVAGGAGVCEEGEGKEWRKAAPTESKTAKTVCGFRFTRTGAKLQTRATVLPLVWPTDDDAGRTWQWLSVPYRDAVVVGISSRLRTLRRAHGGRETYG